MLPVDHVVADEFKAGAENQVVATIPDGKMALDIGPKTIEEYEQVVKGAKTIIWNGPMGVFEMPPFDKGTVALARRSPNPAPCQSSVAATRKRRSRQPA